MIFFLFYFFNVVYNGTLDKEYQENRRFPTLRTIPSCIDVHCEGTHLYLHRRGIGECEIIATECTRSSGLAHAVYETAAASLRPNKSFCVHCLIVDITMAVTSP